MAGTLPAGSYLYFRVTLKQKASMKWQMIKTEKASAWDGRLGWRACIEKLRRSPRVNKGKGRQETAGGSESQTKPETDTERKLKKERIELLVATTEKEHQVRREWKMKRKRG